jgi:hypothetical protein
VLDQILFHGRTRSLIVAVERHLDDTRIPYGMQIPAGMVGRRRPLSSWWCCDAYIQIEMDVEIIAALVTRSGTMKWLMNVSDKTGVTTKEI